MFGFEECSLSSLDLGSKLPVQTAITQSQYCKAVVDTKTLGGDLFTITIPSANEDYIDMSQFRLYVKFKVLLMDGTPALKTSKVSIANNALHSQFKNIQVSLGNTIVSLDKDHYMYKAYIENYYGHNKEYKECVLYGDGLRKDVDLENQNLKYVAPVIAKEEIKAGNPLNTGTAIVVQACCNCCRRSYC